MIMNLATLQMLRDEALLDSFNDTVSVVAMEHDVEREQIIEEYDAYCKRLGD